MSSYGSRQHWLTDDAHIDQRARETFNLQRYQGQCPTWEDIEKAMRSVGMTSPGLFQRTFKFGSPCMLRQVKLGERRLPVKFWHFIYEIENLDKYYEDLFAAGTAHRSPASSVEPPKPISKHDIPENNKNKINELRQRLAVKSC